MPKKEQTYQQQFEDSARSMIEIEQRRDDIKDASNQLAKDLKRYEEKIKDITAGMKKRGSRTTK